MDGTLTFKQYTESIEGDPRDLDVEDSGGGFPSRLFSVSGSDAGLSFYNTCYIEDFEKHNGKYSPNKLDEAVEFLKKETSHLTGFKQVFLDDGDGVSFELGVQIDHTHPDLRGVKISYNHPVVETIVAALDNITYTTSYTPAPWM